ncbi:MAG: helix-turn-helix domain-containing protein [Verrucomicrobia bacterium]|nr:helix-turn-helix domain-containing protein [Verrucomicrobiota bacterium]
MPMSTVAEQLRRAREERKLTVHQIAELTNIKTEHIRALEEGNYHAFAAPVYIRGFVRSCAKILKLDTAQVMATLDAELSKIEKFREPPSLTGERRGPLDFVMYQLSKLNWRVVLPVLGVALLVGIGILAYRIWSQSVSVDPLAKLGPGLYQPPPNGGGEYLPLPTNAPKK